jgi:membrane protease YdiL (CAAX protease family)
MKGAAGLLSSLGLGVCIAAVTIATTPAVVRRATWAQSLIRALRPAVHGAGGGTLVLLAAASALGEELLFRGLLVPIVGVVVSSVLFGCLHHIRGEARWWWMGWAGLMGLLFALVFVVTGNLAGPVFAHLAINAVNLRYVRDHDPPASHRRLGGLLRRG